MMIRAFLHLKSGASNLEKAEFAQAVSAGSKYLSIITAS
jgi:hypothetical protein